MNMQGEIFAAIVNNGNFCGIVNARKLDNGKVFYQHGLAEDRGQLLGVPDSYLARIEYARDIFNNLQAKAVYGEGVK